MVDSNTPSSTFDSALVHYKSENHRIRTIMTVNRRKGPGVRHGMSMCPVRLRLYIFGATYPMKLDRDPVQT